MTRPGHGWVQPTASLRSRRLMPTLGALMGDPGSEKSGRVMQAMLKMKKIIVADLQKAYDGR
ncbi:MAG TPA: hypothetical protein VI750_04475 [Pyrinomonadaceae bacterium]|nr:hypothetical protein [Pyrinomonadaceae bacterium]